MFHRITHLAALLISLALVSMSQPAHAESSYLYWGDWYAGQVQRVTTDGTSAEAVVTTGTPQPYGMAVDSVDGRIYWTDLNTDTLQRADLDGSNVELLISGLTHAPAVTLDVPAGKLYVCDHGAQKIIRANLDGSGAEDFLVGVAAWDIQLDVDGGKIYIADGSGAIVRRELDGTNPETLVTTSVLSIGLDVAGGKIYWTNSSADRVEWANLDGSNPQVMFYSQPKPYGIALDLDAGKLYWADASLDRIQRANLDGSGLEVVHAGFLAAGKLALYDPSAVAQDPDTDGDGIVDSADNCTTVINADQSDLDGDGQGDACDSDDDGDGIDDGTDNCPELANGDQLDTNGNAVGDACDPDDDGDGVADGTDNCPLVPNSPQNDLDGDGMGDECDEDMDGDAVPDESDNCVDEANPTQSDLDSDGVGDICDDAQGAGLFYVDVLFFDVQPQLYQYTQELRDLVDATAGLSNAGHLHSLLDSVEARIQAADALADQLYWCMEKAACKNLAKQAKAQVKSARLDQRDFRLAVNQERAAGHISRPEKRALQQKRRELRINALREMRLSLKRTLQNIRQAF